MASTDEAVRMSYLGSRYEYYEFYVDLLMELDAQQPAAGYGEQAVAAVERSRARSLFDQLTAAAADLRTRVVQPGYQGVTGRQPQIRQPAGLFSTGHQRLGKLLTQLVATRIRALRFRRLKVLPPHINAAQAVECGLRKDLSAFSDRLDECLAIRCGRQVVGVDGRMCVRVG